MTTSSRASQPTIVLVHGAFADATSFQELIGLLQEKHYAVVAVQNPLTLLPPREALGRRIAPQQGVAD